jgi:hypothetical protein
MNYRHFLITRFNLRISGAEMSKDKSGNEVLTAEWLERRFSLFMNYCLPSVINQFNRNFLWLIYFDESTPEVFRYKNQLLEDKYPDILKIVYADRYDAFLKRYSSDILSLCPQNLSHVITTRLDNDDIIHSGFIDRIQNQFAGQAFTTVNFTKILMLSPKNSDKLFIDYVFSNHFISLIEKITPEGIKGCYWRSDRQWVDIPSIQIADRPYCIELISENNLVNDFRGFPVLRLTDLSEFQIHKRIRNKIFSVNNLKFWKMSWKKYFIYLFNIAFRIKRRQ